MANEADQTKLERHRRAIRNAYRTARLTPAQHDRHRARLAERYEESSGRWTRRAGALAAACLMALLVAASIAVWSGLSPNDDGEDDQAVATALPTNTGETGETAAPAVTTTPADPISSPTISETGFGFDPANGACLTSPFSSGEPLDASQAAFTDTWYGDDPEGLWAGLGPEHEGIWTTTNRVLWWRQNPIPIEVTGTRMDDDAPPMNSEMPGGYEGFSHHISILRFPTPGCWEIEASAGDEMRLEFVVEVVPYGETAQGIHVQQQIDAVTAEREDAIPYPVPDTCPASSWLGPESRLHDLYPADLVGEADWRYSYNLDGDSLALNTRLGLLFEGDNPVIWLSRAGNLPASTVMTASKLEDDGSTTTLEMEPPAYDEVVPDGSGGYLTVHGMPLTFPSDGCWTLEVEAADISFSHTVYVYPRVARDVLLDHERIYVVDQDGRVRGRDMETGEELFQFDGGSDVDAALSPDGSRLYLVNRESLMAVDALTGGELWRVAIENRISWRFGIGPSTIAVNQSDERLFVYSSFAPERQWVQVFDASDGSKIGDTETQTGNCPAEMQSSADGETLYLVCIRFGSMRTIDLNSGENIRSMAGQGSGSVVSPDGQTLYVVTTSKRLITIDMDSREIVADAYLDVPAPPTLLHKMVAISPDGARLYVGLGREDDDGDAGSQDVHEIAIIDLADGSTIEVIETNLQFDGLGLAVDLNGWIYANTASDIIRLVPEAPDPTLVAEGQVVVSGDGAEIRQFIVASPLE